MKGEKLSFVATDVRIEQQRNDEQFATLHVSAFASGHNRNNTYISDETLQKTAWTILDKPLLWAYDEERNDAAGHALSEVPCGFIPSNNNNLSFTRLDDGRTMLSVVAKVWKYYSGFLMDFFKRDDSRKPVSVELEVLNSGERDDGSWELYDFTYTGITILGTKVMPAIPGAKALVLNFSEAERQYKEAYEKEVSKFSVATSKIMEEGDSIVRIKNELLGNDSEQVIDDQEKTDELSFTEGEVSVEIAEETDAVLEESSEENPEPQIVLEQNSDESDVPEPEEQNEQPEPIQEELPFPEIMERFKDADGIGEVLGSKDYSGIVDFLYSQILILDKELLTYKEDIASLKQFKEQVDGNQLQKEIDETMEAVKGSLSDDETSVLFEKSKTYNLENIDIWKNEVMAAAYLASLNSKPQAKLDMSASLPEKKEKKNGVKLLW